VVEPPSLGISTILGFHQRIGKADWHRLRKVRKVLQPALSSLTLTTSNNSQEPGEALRHAFAQADQGSGRDRPVPSEAGGIPS